MAVLCFSCLKKYRLLIVDLILIVDLNDVKWNFIKLLLFLRYLPCMNYDFDMNVFDLF